MLDRCFENHENGSIWSIARSYSVGVGAMAAMADIGATA